MDQQDVISLWHERGLVRPWNDPHRDIARKLSEQPGLFLVGVEAEAVVATVMAGFDGHRGWAYYLAVAPTHRNKSYGTQLMREVEHLLAQRGCPKLNLLVRSSNLEVIEFYKKLGYTQDEVISLGRRLIHDHDT